MWKNLKTVKKCGKALYLVGSLEHMCIYLESLYDGGWITAEEMEKLEGDITTECAGITMAEVNEIRKNF